MCRTTVNPRWALWIQQVCVANAAVATINASYPFLNGERFIFHERADSRNALIVAKGGGLEVLDADSRSLAPLRGVKTSLKLETQNTGGQIHSFAPDLMQPDTQRLFVAAGHAGLFRLETSTYSITSHVLAGDAWSVSSCGDLVVVGTHSSKTEAPALTAYDATSLHQLWTEPMPGDVWATACSQENNQSESVSASYTLIVGGWCFGLRAYAISRSGMKNIGQWSETDAQRQRLYASYSCSSVIAFDISVPNRPSVWAVRPLQNNMVFGTSLGPANYIYIGLPASEDHDRSPNGTSSGMPKLGTGVALVDVSSKTAFSSGAVTVLPIAYSAIAQVTLPTDRRNLIVADGSNGLYSLYVDI